MPRGDNMEHNKSIVEELIANARNHLLDTSFNNRMINSKITLNKGLSFSVEDLNSFYDAVINGNPFSFLSMEKKKKDKHLLKEASIENNKLLDKVGSIQTINILNSTNKPSLLHIKFTLEDGESKLIYTTKSEEQFYTKIDDLYKDVKKNFTKFSILQDNIYNKNVHFSGFRRKIDEEFDSNTLALYLAIVSVLRGEGIPKEYAFLGGFNKKQEITAVKGVEQKLTFAYEKGIKKVFVSKKNKKDVKTLSDEVMNNLEIVYISNVDDAVLAVFDMLNTVQSSNADSDFILSKSKQPQKVFYVNYNEEDLKNRISKIYINSKRHIEEQGINILFLSLAFAQWKNPMNEDEEINSPLIFIPVNIETSNYKNVYKLSYSNSEVLLNKSLIKKLELDLSLDLSALQLDVSDEVEFNVSDYLESFRDLTKDTGHDFSIDYHSVHLSFYSYNKFLMYNDLDLTNWNSNDIATKKNVLTDIFDNSIYHEVSNVDDDKNIDNTVEIDEIKNILDADSSQLLAISKVNRGNSIIIQGPPGTGKSQTIVNIIAEGIRNNKKILFMSEKLAAMEVVYNRLKNINLHHVALQLHSDKINKAQVVKELQSIYYMNKINVKNKDTNIKEKLHKLREEINHYYELLNKESVYGKINIIEAYRVIIELENFFENNKIKHYELEIPSDYLMNQEDSTFEDLFQDLESLENFNNRYGSSKDSVLKPIKLTSSISHHNLVRYTNQLNEILSMFIQIIKDVSYNRIAYTKQGKMTYGDLKTLLKIKNVDNTVFEYVPNINHKLMLESEALLEEIMNHFNVIQTPNTDIKEDVYTNVKFIDHLQKFEDTLRKEISYLSDNDSFFEKRSKAVKEYTSIVVSKYFHEEPKNTDELVESLQWLHSNILFKLLLRKEDVLLEKIFGPKYKTDKDNFEIIQSVYNSVEQIFNSITEVFKDKEDNQSLYIDYFKKFIQKDFSMLSTLEETIQSIEDSLLIEHQDIYVDGQMENTPLHTILERFTDIKNHIPNLNDSIVQKSLEEALIERINDSYLKSLLVDEHYDSVISKVFKYIRYHSIVKDLLNHNHELENFNALIFEKKVREFIMLDNKKIQMNNLQAVLDAHFYNVYNVRKDETLSVENKDERISYLLQTFNKKHNIPSIKRLLKTALEPITELKPVFMMSPISISQFLEPMIGMFDIVVFDEASQIKPQDAFGALLRGKQVVVVGDEHQLPPTNFFESFYGSTEIFSEDAISNFESILTLLRGNGVPLTTLNWHYRSKHHNLIHINNEHFYDKSLSIFPSKFKNNSEYGLKYEFVDGIFDRGRSRTNLIEAQKVAKEVLKHAKQYPNDSLGVATLNINQRDLILSELKKLRKKDPSLDSFFTEDKREPFFVKNLENVQGDEREVILISIGYAKDLNDNIIQNFGAINHVGGERRLNVLFSRARRKCVIYSGLKASDLEVDANTSEGIKVFRKFLDYAERNTKNEDSPVKSDTKLFAIEIANELYAQGYEVSYNVGNSNYYVDLAVINPEEPTEYILGIEFDNSTYHQSRTASERERIRNSVMRSKGWAIYKIYITSWFNNRNQEINNILKYLKSLDTIEHDSEEVIEFIEEPVNVVTRFGFVPYMKYQKPIENINFFMKETEEFDKYLSELIYMEMPVKLTNIQSRIVENSHLQIKPQSIKKRLKKALNRLEHDHVIYDKDGFYHFYKKESFITFRDRRNLNEDISISDISQDEFLFAIEEIARNSFGINTEEISTIISNYLGYEGINEAVVNIVETLSIRLISVGTIEKDENNNLQIK